MKLALTTAILGDMQLKGLMEFLGNNAIPGAEVMCWPVGGKKKDTRKFAGVTHIDAAAIVSGRDNDLETSYIRAVTEAAGVTIAALGYYPNTLSANLVEARVFQNHIRRVILAAERLGIPVVNTFAGRDQSKRADDPDFWRRFRRVWRGLVVFAEDHNVNIGIENCPMRFTKDEWPGGKNVATSPAIWERMFSEVDSPNFGLCIDPSHFVLQFMDIVPAVCDFGSKIHFVHAKDLRIDRDRLDRVGTLADDPKSYHTPCIPGEGEVPWSRFFAALRNVGYEGWVSIEIEAPEYDPDRTVPEDRQESVLLSRDFLERFVADIPEPTPQPAMAKEKTAQ